MHLLTFDAVPTGTALNRPNSIDADVRGHCHYHLLATVLKKIVASYVSGHGCSSTNRLVVCQCRRRHLSIGTDVIKYRLTNMLPEQGWYCVPDEASKI